MQVETIQFSELKEFYNLSFPLALSPSNVHLSPENEESIASTEDLIKYIRKNKEKLSEQLTQHGALLFRGFEINDAKDFDAMAYQGFQWSPLPYVGGAAPRKSVIGNVFTTNESPPECKIPFHHEMAQVEKYPTRLFFYCDVPPTSGGQTPLCRSDVVFERMYAEFPSFCDQLMEQGVRYTRIMSAEDDNTSPIGRGWHSTYHTMDKQHVEQKTSQLGIEIEWLESGDLKTITKALPAIKTHPITKKKVWFNSIVAVFTGWTDSRNDGKRAVTFADGTYLPEDIIMRCLEIMNECCVDITWKKGDVFVIDNELVLHARRSFEPPRKIYAAISTVF